MSERTELTGRDRQLLEEIEEIVANGGGERREADSLYGFCAHLVSTVPQADDAFRQRLEARLIARMQQRQKVRTLGTMSQDKGEARSPSWLQRLAPGVWRMLKMNPLAMKGEMKMSRKAVLVAMALVALISVAFFAYPPTRTWAQDVLARFQSTIITNAPTNVRPVQNPTPTPMGQPTSTPIAAPLRILTVEEANKEAGFEILSPTYIPAGYQLIARGVHRAAAGVAVGTTYAMVGTTYDPTYGLEDGTPTMRLIQNRYVSEFTGEFPVGDAPTTQVEVRGEPGLWVEQAEVGCCDEDRNVILADLLIWQEGDFLVDLRSDNMPLEEMLRIAESLE